MNHLTREEEAEIEQLPPPTREEMNHDAIFAKRLAHFSKGAREVGKVLEQMRREDEIECRGSEGQELCVAVDVAGVGPRWPPQAPDTNFGAEEHFGVAGDEAARVPIACSELEAAVEGVLGDVAKYRAEHPSTKPLLERPGFGSNAHGSCFTETAAR
jgi:hypothetical protein